MPDLLTRLTELGVELPKTRAFNARISAPVCTPSGESHAMVSKVLADAMRDELLALLVAEREARVRAEADNRALGTSIDNAKKRSDADLENILELSEGLKQAEAEVALRGRMLELFVTDYVNGEEPGWYGVRFHGEEVVTVDGILADLRDRAGGGKP